MYKISFCTAIRNRLRHLRETLVQNIIDNSDYPYLQFIVLDYNSNDGLDDWIKLHMTDHLKSGRLIYYRTDEPEYFHRSHSRNMAFKLADGEVVCNIDADNYTGKGFARYVSSRFENEDRLFLTNGIAKADFIGRIACLKKDFERVGGYDEQMDGYGFEDYDFINRLKLTGLKQYPVTEKTFFKAISHDDSLRVGEEKNTGKLYQVYVSWLSVSASNLILLFKDGTCRRGKIIDCFTLNSETPENAFKPKIYEYEFALEEADWIHGTWLETDAAIMISESLEHSKLIEKLPEGIVIMDGKWFFRLTDTDEITSLVMFYNQFVNRNKMILNRKNGNERVNNSFGSGRVYKNFLLHQPVDLT